jgi:PAS domain S-box-containing protein
MKTPLRLLLVEDSETDALFLLRELRREYGHEPIFERVETAEEMAAALDGAPWDAVVSDYFVPDFGALKALALLKEKGLDLPFIVVSGVVGEQAAVAAMRAGAHDFVMKNNLARLVPTIERELREAEERRRKRRAEEALRESQERFRSLVRHSSDISVILDADGTILYESPAVEWVLGFRAEERIGTNALDHLHPDDVGTARSKIAEILDKPDDRLSVEYRVRNKEGSWRCFEAIGSNLLHEPAIRGIVVNSRDITERKRTEEALRKSEANLAEAQRVAQVGSWELDLASKELYWSDETYRIFGFVPGEVSPNVQRFTELVHPEDRERVRAMLREASAAGNRCSGEFRITRADWTERVIHSTVEIVHDGEGRPVRAAGTNHDITERKLAEDKLRRSEERFRSLVQNSLDVIVVVDANATVSYYSPSVEAVLGYEPEEFVGKNVLQTIPIHSEDLPQARRVFGYAVDNPGVNHSVELRMRHANGTWRTVEATANNLLDDPSVGGIVTNYRDVTERRRVEEKLREAEERFRRAFDDAAIGMVMSTLDARFLQVNGALCEMLGRSEEELLGASFRDVTHPEDVETSVDHVQRLLKGEVSSFELEKRYLHADGHPVWTVVHCSLVRDEADRPLYVIGQIQDITDRKRAEEALRESELRYRAVVEDQTELICRFLPDGTLTFVNEAYCRAQLHIARIR